MIDAIVGAAVGLDPPARSKLAHALLLASNDVLCGSGAKDLLQSNDSSTPSLWFRTLLLAYYVIIGSATFLVVRLTETHGKLSYNTSVAVLLTEGLKLLVARGLSFTTETQVERQAARGVSWAEAQNSEKSLPCIVTFYTVKYTRALTVQNFCPVVPVRGASADLRSTK